MNYKLLEPTPNWTDDERPTIPGSPSTPYHAPPVRLAYFLVGLLVGVTGGLGNAFIAANLPNIQGDLGLTPVEGAWLAAVYIMFNVTSNLILFKCRQQFGIRTFAEVAMVINVLMMLIHISVHSYETALLVRAISGFTAAPMSALGVFYVLQAFPKKYMGNGLCMALGVSQLAIPVAWVISPSVLNIGDWRTIYLCEMGLTLCSFAAVFALKLPPGMRIKVFEKLDFVTFALWMPGVALLCAVLLQGRLQWWTEQPWMAFALIAGMFLLMVGWFIEHHRTNPLIQTRWLGSGEALRFAAGALIMRFLLSEQTFAATNLLRTLGMGPDQMAHLYGIILLGLVCGFVFSAATFGPKMVIVQLALSLVLILFGSLIDRNATSLVRPHDLYPSQFMLAFANGMFMGPLLLIGVMKALSKGAHYIVTFAVMFSMSQAVGGALGGAVYGTFQQSRQHEYSAQMIMHVEPTDPIVSQRIQIQSQMYQGVITDPVLRNAQGAATLSKAVTQEAQVRAYNDVFTLNAIIGTLFLLITAYHIIGVMRKKKAEDKGKAGSSQGDAGGAAAI